MMGYIGRGSRTTVLAQRDADAGNLWGSCCEKGPGLDTLCSQPLGYRVVHTQDSVAPHPCAPCTSSLGSVGDGKPQKRQRLLLLLAGKGLIPACHLPILEPSAGGAMVVIQAASHAHHTTW